MNPMRTIKAMEIGIIGSSPSSVRRGDRPAIKWGDGEMPENKLEIYTNWLDEDRWRWL